MTKSIGVRWSLAREGLSGFLVYLIN
jgi:hypothetical protein